MKPTETPTIAAALQSEPAAPQLLSIRECAARTGASVGFWRRELRLRRIRAYRLGDLVRIAEADLATYIAQREARQ